MTYSGRQNTRLIAKKRLLSLVGCMLSIILVVSPILSGMIVPVSAASIMIIPPPDKTVTATGASTKVSLGTSEISGTTDPTVIITNNAPGSTQASSGVVGHWPFDDTLEDNSGSLNNGVAKGDAHLVSSQMTKSLKLDGAGDYVTVNDKWNLQLDGAFTLSAWIKLDTLYPDGSWTRILEKGTSPGEKYWMFYIKSSKKIGFGFINSEDVSVLTSKTDWQVGKWYHIAGTYDPKGGSNNMKIYVDGVLNNQATKTGSPVANTKPLLIGAKSTTDTDFWEGGIDEVSIYRKALTATEVASLYKSPYVSLPRGTNIITWKVTADNGVSASAVQMVNVVDSSITIPDTSLAINGVRYIDPLGQTFVTSDSHFDLSVVATGGADSTKYRFFEVDDLVRPAFKTGTYFQLSGSNGEYVVQFYSVDAGIVEPLTEKKVVLDNTSPMTLLNVVGGTTKVRLTATDNYEGSGVGDRSTSGIFYKLDSAASYTFVQSDTIDLSNVVNGKHTIYYYSVDNLGNQENTKSATFSGITKTFCSSGCDYNNLQTAVNALPIDGGKIYIKDGSYAISSSITLKSGTILDFSSGSSIYFRGDGTPLFKGTGLSNIEIIGGDITAELAGSKAFSFTDSKGIKVTGTRIEMVKGSNSNGFYCLDCMDVYISSINIKSATRLIDIKSDSGITDGHSSNIWIQNGIFDDSAIEGVRVPWSTNVHILGNTVTNTVDNGIDIGWSENAEIRNNRLTRTGYPYGAAIHTDSANGADVTDNYIDTTGKTAIPVYRASNINVIGNTIINAGDQALSIIAKIEPSSFIKVKSNHIIDSTGIGIYESPEQTQVEIAFNTLEQIPTNILPISIVGSNPTSINYGNIIE